MKIINDFDIKKRSLFHIGGLVRQVAVPESATELIHLLTYDKYDYVLGNCSNILFTSDYIDKKIILTSNVNTIRFHNNKIYVQCGALAPKIAKACATKGLSGCEFMIGIPGSIGGLICMNAGINNKSISDILESAKVFNPASKHIELWTNHDFAFAYRYSDIQKNNSIIISANFALQQMTSDSVYKHIYENLQHRQQTQPSLKYGNIGCTFKNPPNNFAGKLLDTCNMRGKSIRNAKVSDIHANFILNCGNATSYDVILLMYQMYMAVYNKYGIKLQPEIKYIGNENSYEFKLWQEMNSYQK